MSQEPLNTNDVKFYLDFLSDGTGRMEILEPIGFDGLKFLSKTDDGRYASISKWANVPLQIDSSEKEVFDMLLLYDKIYGINSEVNFIITTYAVDYIVGSLDFIKALTDGVTIFEIEVIRNLRESLIDNRRKTKVNLFDTRNLDLEPITPVSTSKILLKAKPTVQNTEWENVPFFAYTGVSFNTNLLHQSPIKNLTSFGVQDSYTWIDNTTASDEFLTMANADNFQLLSAKNDLTDIKLTFKGIKLKYLVPAGDPFLSTGSWINGQTNILYRLYLGIAPAPNDFTASYNLDYTYEYVDTFDANTKYGISGMVDEYLVTIADVTFDLPAIPKDNGLWGVFMLGRILTIVDWTEGSVLLKATSTGIDSVIDGVRINDAQKYIVESTSGNTVNAPLFESGGKHYDNFIFSGKMCRGFTDIKFNVSFESIVNQLIEICGDYKTTGSETFFGEYADFYPNIEIGSYPQAPNTDYRETANERYAINNIEFSYKEYETDKDTENTVDSVHTKSSWNVTNKFVSDQLKLEIEFTRDPLKIEFVRERSTQTKPTTALSEDDKVFITKVVQLPPNQTRIINATLTHNINSDGNVQLLNDGSFNWSLIGTSIGDEFKITEGENTGTYTIVSFDFTLIELQPIGTPTFTGAVFTTVVYPITAALYTNQTNEGFTLIEGVENPEDFGNLLYTIRRNLKRWEPYLKTCIQNSPSGIINNIEFVNGGNLTTQYQGGEVITENADFVKENMTDAILSNKVLTTTLIVDYSEYNTIKSGLGFIRVPDNKGGMKKIHIKEDSYSWNDNLLEIEIGEIRLESEFVEIQSNSGLIIINEVGYETQIVDDVNYKASSGIVTIKDTNQVPMINPTRFDFIKVNGVAYDTVEQLTQAIEALL